MTLPSDPLFAATQRALAGQYSLERELGRGGMGVVYLAREVELDRLVAIKVLARPEITPEIREQFLREARMAASLSHPHVVPIYRVGEAGDIVYFSMGFVDGGTLGDRLRARGPLSVASGARLLREVAQALAYAHGRGIVHRDIKPDNILIDQASGRALVSDFGIAASGMSHRAAPHVLGTVHFMSPEQAAGLTVDARSDIYSLGVVGFLSLSGRLPVASGSLGEIAPTTPSHIVDAVDRARAHDASRRYTTAEQFADALELRSLEQQSPGAPLREWLNTRDPWAVPYVAWSGAMVVTAAIQLGRNDGAMDAAFALAIALQPVAPAALFQIRKARKVFDAGYTVNDLREILRTSRREDVAAQLDEIDRPAPLWHSGARVLAWLPIAYMVRGYIMTAWYNHAPLLNRGWSYPVALMGSAFGLAIITALGVPPIPRALLSPAKGFSARFWGSRLGEWTERLLIRGRKRAVPPGAFRPTESVLATAISDLFAALPAPFRDQLSELPEVIQRLEVHAQHAREALAHLDGVTAVARDSQLSAAKDRARHQLTESVSALESVRLDLLRLLGGDAEMRHTTTVISAAHRVDRDLQRLHAATREVDRNVRPLGLDLRPHTPV